MPEQTQVLPRALALATEIAENVSPQAASLNRELMWRGPESAEEAHILESDVIYNRFISPYVCFVFIVVPWLERYSADCFPYSV
jgi:enoyl-CoA hydratase/carnithine racemase